MTSFSCSDSNDQVRFTFDLHYTKKPSIKSSIRQWSKASTVCSLILKSHKNDVCCVTYKATSVHIDLRHLSYKGKHCVAKKIYNNNAGEIFFWPWLKSNTVSPSFSFLSFFYSLSLYFFLQSSQHTMLLPLKKKKAPTTDEENSLCIESSSRYGAIPAASAHSSDESSHSDPEEGEGGSSSHSSIKKRKKRRMEQRHCCKKSRPKISSRLSSMLHHGSKKRHSSDSEDDLRATNLVLPALDPK